MVKRVPCEICGKRILGQSFLKTHKKRVHKELVEEVYL
jgi:hypothetical protein